MSLIDFVCDNAGIIIVAVLAFTCLIVAFVLQDVTSYDEGDRTL